VSNFVCANDQHPIDVPVVVLTQTKTVSGEKDSEHDVFCDMDCLAEWAARELEIDVCPIGHPVCPAMKGSK
jgi:hypothetical protein